MSDDAAIPLSRMRARLARPRGAKRVEALISAEDAAGAVAALSVVELYQLIREVGFADSYQLVELATGEQVRGCIDLDVWDRDRVQLEAVKPWLAAAVDAGFEQVGQVWAALDQELAALTIARQCHIYDLSLGEEVPDSDDRPMYLTPDSFFAVAIDAEDEESIVLIRRVLDDLYKADMTLARHTLMAARSEPVAELEEMSYRWRSGRLADLGYVDYYEALEVFRAIDAASVVIGEGSQDEIGATEDGEEARMPGELPVPMAERIVGRSFLARALDAVDDRAEAERLESAFLILINKVLSALRTSPGDEDRVRAGADYAVGTLALGLELVSRGDVDLAAQALQTVSLTRLHRLGYTSTLRLARLARALAPRASTAGDPAAAVVDALLAQRPMFAGELDQPPAAEPRAFESTHDVRLVAETLTRLALRVAVAEAVGAHLLEAGGAGPDLDDYIRTALVRAMVGGETTTTPLSAAELRRFVGSFAGGALTDDARLAAATALGALLDRESIDAGRELVPALLQAWFADLEDSFAGLAPDADPDPRFVAGVITAGDRA